MPPHRYLPRAAALPWIWSLQKHPRRAIRKWLHSTHLHRSPLASRLNLRFRARQVAVAHAAFSLAATGTDPQGHAYNCSQEGGVLMTLGDRRSVVEGKSVSVRVSRGGGRKIKKKNNNKNA